jgi:hypothetical protein
MAMLDPAESSPLEPPAPPADDESLDHQSLDDQLLERRITRLFTVQLYLRWFFNLGLWLTVGTVSLWGLRGDIALWLDYFTWAAVRASLRYNRGPFFGLALCVSMTLATLIWHSAHILWGMSAKERYYFTREVELIATKGPKHWLWRWVCEEKI